MNIPQPSKLVRYRPLIRSENFFKIEVVKDSFSETFEVVVFDTSYPCEICLELAFNLCNSSIICDKCLERKIGKPLKSLPSLLPQLMQPLSPRDHAPPPSPQQ